MKTKSINQEIDPEVQMIFDELRKTYGAFDINKKQLSNVLGCSLSNINKRIHSGLNIPRYRKFTANGRVMFSLLDVAKYLVRCNIIEIA
jgi:hypothetical protein